MQFVEYLRRGGKSGIVIKHLVKPFFEQMSVPNLSVTCVIQLTFSIIKNY